jgi:hypothetical protein|tara:strand:+ start:16 stop:483 length:468 start_codon:yes stop_codon:yes gene_type:complete
MATCECGAEINNPVTDLAHKAGAKHREWAAKSAMDDLKQTEEPVTAAVAVAEPPPQKTNTDDPDGPFYIPADVQAMLDPHLALMNDRGYRDKDAQAQAVAKGVRYIWDMVGWMSDPEHETVTQYLKRMGIPIVDPSISPHAPSTAPITATGLRPQ